MNGNKPDWKDAPEWAKYLAMDSNGVWWWYSEVPRAGRYAYIPSDSCVAEKVKTDCYLWDETLEERPE